MSVLNLLPIAPPATSSPREPALAAVPHGRREGKTFELPAPAASDTETVSAVAGVTELEASSLASGQGKAESSASPQTVACDLSDAAATLAATPPLAEEAPVNQDSRLNRLRNGDKLPDPAKSGLAALLPFTGTALTTALAPQPAMLAAAAEVADDTSPLSGAADDSAESGEPAAGVSSQTVQNDQTALLAVPPVPVAPAPLAPQATRSAEHATSILDTPVEQTDEAIAKPALPLSAAEIVPVSAGSGARELPMAKPLVANAAKPTPVATPPQTPAPAVAAIMPSAAVPPLMVAAGVTTAHQEGAASRSPEDERLPAGDERPADVAAVPMPEGSAVANHGGQGGGNKNAASRKGSGATLDFKAKDSAEMSPHAAALSSPPASAVSPTAELPTTLSPGLVIEAAALPPVAPAPSLQPAPVPTESMSTAASGEHSAAPSRDAENLHPSTPRALDVRSQAWRENLLETARLRMPALGAAGTLQTITLQLQPRLMGTVTMTLALTASGGVQLRLGASSERTRRFFTAEAPAIAASFARGGLNVSRIEILESQSDPAAA